MAATSVMLRSSSSRLFSQQLPPLVGDLSSSEDEVRLRALEGLALLIDSSPEEDLSELCRLVRERGGCEALTALIADSSSVVHQNAMLVLGNVASERVDPACEATKQLLRTCGTIDYIVPHLWSEVYDTVLYALGALLNLCADICYVEMLQEQQVPERLQEIAQCGDLHLERFAKGCLHNIREAILQLLAMRQLTNRQAATKLTALAMGFLARLRYRRLLAMRRRLEEWAATVLQAAWRTLQARRFYLFLLRLFTAQKHIVEDIIDAVVVPLSQELAQELWDAANSWVARDLTNMVVAEEAAAIAAECLSLREKALEDVCDDLMTTTVDRECAVVAAECLEEYHHALELVRDGLVDQLVDGQAEEVALESLIEFEVDGLVSDLVSQVEMEGTQAAAAHHLLQKVVEEESAALASEVLAQEYLVSDTVREEAAKIAAEALAGESAACEIALELVPTVADAMAREVAVSTLGDLLAAEALWRFLQIDSANERLLCVTVDAELAVIAADAFASRALARERWRLAARRAILLNRALAAMSDTRTKRVAAAFAEECARRIALRVADEMISAALARLTPRKMELPKKVLRPLKASKSLPEVKPPRPPPKLELPPVIVKPPPKPLPKVEPKPIARREHKKVEIPRPQSLNRLGLPVDGNGYVILPEVTRRRRMYGLRRTQHATFPELRIDDKTEAHRIHLSMADETIRAPKPSEHSPQSPRVPVTAQLDARSGEDVSSQISKMMAASAGKLLDLFRAWDADSNGRVDKKEVRRALEHLGYPVGKGELNSIFVSLGGGEDGWLEYGKLKRALTNANEGISWHAGWCRSTGGSSSSEIRYANTPQPVLMASSSPRKARVGTSRSLTPSPEPQSAPQIESSEEENAD